MMNIHVDCLIKRTIILPILFLVFLSSKAQSYVCTIEGSTTDTETTKIYLVESGADIRTSSGVITIPVENGRFNYVLKGKEKQYYQLIADNHYHQGCIRAAYIIAENQHVVVTMGRADGDQVTVKGNGKETRMLQRCKDEIDAVYAPKIAVMDQKQDSLESLLKRHIESLSPSEKESFLNDLQTPHSKTPLIAAYQQNDNEYRALLDEEMLATAKWLDAHPCIYGLFNIKETLSAYRASSNVTTPFLIRSYQQTYSKKYRQHPYHESIKNSLQSLELVPGNHYINYTVSLPDGKQAEISSLYTGKVIYIDLWASWCGPCRKHSKELIPIYEKYKDKGFQIIGIARETKAENMQKAIQQDQYPWLCLLELNDQNQVWLKNGISNAAGGGFLILKDGTILSVYPDAEETERLLKKHLE